MGAFRELGVDTARHIVYASTSTGTIERYDYVAQTVLPSFKVGNSLNGMDITADGNFAYVAEGVRGATQALVRKVNLTTGAVTNIGYDLTSGQTLGTYDVAIAANGQVFVTSLVTGGPLRQIDSATDSISIRADYGAVQGNALLSRSASANAIALADKASNTPLARYNADTDTWLKTTISGFLTIPPSLSRDGNFIASGGVIRDQALANVTTVPFVTASGFDPFHDMFYGFVGSFGSGNVIAYNMNGASEWTEQYRFPTDSVTESAMGQGQMAFDSNGTMFFLGTSSGVRVYAIPQPTREEASVVVGDFPRFIRTGVQGSFSVRVLDPTLHLADNFRGTVHLSSNDPSAILPADYTFTAADDASHSFTATFNTPGTNTITVTSLASSRSGSQSNIIVHDGAVGEIPIAGYQEMVFDPNRKIIYISTDPQTGKGTIERYDTVTQTVLSPINTPNPLRGIDITPDGRFLYVADAVAINGQGVFRKVDTSTLAITTLPFNLAAGEEGAWDIAITANGIAFATLTTTGRGTPSTALRQIDLATDTISTVTNFPLGQHTALLERSADYRNVFLLDTNNYVNNIGYYDSSTASWKTTTLGIEGYGAPSFSRDHRWIAVTGQGILILDQNLVIQKRLIGVSSPVFDPTRDVLYASGAKGIVAFDTNTWVEKYTIKQPFSPGGFGVGGGRMIIRPDGSTLELTTYNGLGEFTIPIPSGQPATLAMTAAPTLLRAGTHIPLSVAISDSAGTPASLYRGTIHFSSNDPLAVLPPDNTFTADDNGSHTFDVVFNTISPSTTFAGTTSLTVADPANAALTATQTAITVHMGAAFIPDGSRKDQVFDAGRNRLYFTTNKGTIERYDLTTQSMLPPIVVSTDLNGMDITPDGHYLIVADNVSDPLQAVLHKVDLETGAIQDLRFDRNTTETAAFDVAIASNGMALVTTTGNCCSPPTPPRNLRVLDLATNTFSVAPIPGGVFAIERGPSGNIGAVLDVLPSPYTLRTWNPATNTFSAIRQLNWGAPIAISPDGTLIATQNYLMLNAAVFRASDLAQLKLLDRIDGGMVFDPTTNRFIGVDSSNDKIVAYDTTTWTKVWEYAPPNFSAGRAGWQGDGVMSISTDGELIFLNSINGISIFTLRGAPTLAAPTNLAQGQGGTFSFTAKDYGNNTDPRYDSTVHFTSNDPNAVLPPDYKFSSADGGIHSFPITFNTVGPHTVTATDLVTGKTFTSATTYVSGVQIVSRVLTITGTPGYDAVSVMTDGVKVDVQSWVGQATFDYSQIDSVSILMLGGNDTVDMENQNLVRPPTPRLWSGTVDLGDGDDLFQTAGSSSTLPLTINAGAGADRIRFMNDVDLKATIAGGTESDSVELWGDDSDEQINIGFTASTIAAHQTVNYSNIEKIIVNAFGGNNTINIAAFPTTQIITGNGNDVFNINSGSYNSTVHMDSGDGNDRIVLGADFLGYSYLDDNLTAETGSDTAVILGTSQIDTISVTGPLIWAQALSNSSSKSLNNTWNVDRVEVNTFAGDDRIGVFNVAMKNGTPVIIDAGDGKDTITVDTRQSVLDLTLLGGAGDDAIRNVNFTPVSVFDGGPGTDTAWLSVGTGPNTVININAAGISSSGKSMGYPPAEAILVESTFYDDIFNIAPMPFPITVMGDDGNDTFYVGAGRLNGYSGVVTLDGMNGVDAVVLDDRLNTTPTSYTFDYNVFSSPGVAGIAYPNTEVRDFYAGSGSDVINTPFVAYQVTQNVYAGDGDDSIVLNGVSQVGSYNVFGGNGNDTFTYNTAGMETANFSGENGANTIRVTAGAMNVNSDISFNNENIAVDVGPQGTLYINSTQHLDSLNIQSGGRVNLQNGTPTLITKQLTVAGILDLLGNQMVVQATPATRAQVLAAVEGYIRSAYNTSPTHWQGRGITSSSAATTPNRAVGVMLNGAGGTRYSIFQGQSVDDNSILVAYTLIGDVNLNRAVSISDFIELSSNYNTAGGWGRGDMNFDGQITISDFIDVAANFNQHLATEEVDPIPQAPASLSPAGQSSDDAEILTVTRSKRQPDSRHHRRPRLHHRSPKRRATAQWRSRAGLIDNWL